MTALSTQSLGRLSAVLAAIGVFLLTAAPARAVEQARPADSFVDSIGVNLHTSYDDSPYGTNLDAIGAKLQELGVRHIRDGLELDRADQYHALNALAARGVQSTLIFGEPDMDDDEFEQLLATLKSDVRGAVEAVEGPNEIDMHGDTSQLPALADYQQRLYRSIKEDPELGGLPVLGPSLVQKRNQKSLGDISGSLDYGNIHPYPDGGAPEDNLPDHLVRAAVNSADRPVMATESGYHTALGWTEDLAPVSEGAMATYMPRLFLEYFRLGVARTFSYELIDQKPDSVDREDNFGLLRNDFSEKPAFTTLRNLIEMLEDRGPGFAPAGVDYTFGGNTVNLRHVLLQKSDGGLYMALWRAVDASAPASPLTVSFGQRITRTEVFLPNVSSIPLHDLPASASGALTVNVGPRVAILKLTLGDKKAVPGRIRAWVSKRSQLARGRLAIRGRLPKQARGRVLRFKIQRRQRGWRHWRTIGRGRTTRKGSFRKRLHLASRRRGVSRFRVVARAAKPSRPVRVRFR